MSSKNLIREVFLKPDTTGFIFLGEYNLEKHEQANNHPSFQNNVT